MTILNKKSPLVLQTIFVLPIIAFAIALQSFGILFSLETQIALILFSILNISYTSFYFQKEIRKIPTREFASQFGKDEVQALQEPQRVLQ